MVIIDEKKTTIPENVKIYDKFYEIYKMLYTTLKKQNLYDKLSRIL